MKLIMIQDHVYKELASKIPVGDIQIIQSSDFIADIEKNRINVIKSRYSRQGFKTPEELMDIIAEQIFRAGGGIFKSETKPVVIDDPELDSDVYDRNCLWVLVYDNEKGQPEVVMDRIFINEEEATLGAKELVAEDASFDGKEISVVGVPFQNLKYGKTIPGFVEETIDISDETFLKLAKTAHEQNITLNELVTNLLQEYIDDKIKINLREELI